MLTSSSEADLLSAVTAFTLKGFWKYFTTGEASASGLLLRGQVLQSPERCPLRCWGRFPALECRGKRGRQGGGGKGCLRRPKEERERSRV